MARTSSRIILSYESGQAGSVLHARTLFVAAASQGGQAVGSESIALVKIQLGGKTQSLRCVGVAVVMSVAWWTRKGRLVKRKEVNEEAARVG